MFSPQQLDFPSLAFPKDRSVLYVGEVALKLRVTDQHVIDLITEGKMAAVDIAGRQSFVRVPQAALEELADRLGITLATLLQIIGRHRAKVGVGRAFWRVPVVEGFNAFIRENHSLAVDGK